MDHAFDQAIALTHTGSPDLFLADLPESWRVHRGPINGGLTVSLALQGLLVRLEELGHPDPLCVSAFYLAAADPGPTEVHTEIIRSGRSMSTGQASVWQPGPHGIPLERLRATATFADLGQPAAAEVLTVARPPYLPPPEECVHIDDIEGYPRDEVEVMQHYDMRIDPATTGGPDGRPSGLGQLRAWFRMRDGREPSALLLPLVVDAFPPIAWDLGVSGWVPTLELTVHVRARPAPGWLRVEITSANLAGGFVEEDAEVWDSADRMVAQARQLAKVITAPAGVPVGHGWVV